MKFGRKSKGNKESRELGFGTKSYGPNTRLIARDGGFNVNKTGLKFWQSLDTYHELISMKWGSFILLVSSVFFFANLIFALLYFFAGSGSIAGAHGSSVLDRFLDSFYFSTQTITTVGFGQLSPNSNFVSVLAAIESFMGLLGFALATGLMFARFSRPRKRLVYSENAIVAPYRDINGLMFRFANSGKNHLIETEVDVFLSYWNLEEDRRFFERLKLERSKINFFTTSWTVVHPIDNDSPLQGMTPEECANHHMEVIIMFKAFDDTYARTVYDRNSYIHSEIKWGQKFVPIFTEKGDGQIHIDLEKIGQYESAALN